MSLEPIIAVYLSSIVELWIAIPLGFALGLNPWIICFVSAAGSITAAIGVSLIGDNIRDRFLNWKYKDEKSLKKSRMHHIWKKYGVVGLGLLSPLLLGAPLGAAMGIALGVARNSLIFWMSVGIILWSIGLTLLGIGGIHTFINV
jgi:membrane protein YqaA with SNARE-associated domain